MQKLITTFFIFLYFTSTLSYPMSPILEITPEQSNFKNIGFKVSPINWAITKKKRTIIEQIYFCDKQEIFTKELWKLNIQKAQHIRHNTSNSKLNPIEQVLKELIDQTAENPIFLLQECMQWNCALNREPSFHKERFEIHKKFLGEDFKYFSNKRSNFEEKVIEKTKTLFSDHEPITITFFAAQNLFAEARIIEKILKNKIPIKQINLIDTAYKNTTNFLDLCSLWNVTPSDNKYTLHTIIKKLDALSECTEEINQKKQIDILCTLFTWFQFTNLFEDKENKINFYFYPGVQNYLKTETKSHIIIGIDFQEPPANGGEKTYIIEEQNKQALNDFRTLTESLHKEGVTCSLYNDYTSNTYFNNPTEPVLEIIDQWMTDTENTHENFTNPSFLCPFQFYLNQPCSLL